MPLPSNDPANLTRTLDVARRDLLDLGLRNTLLNYRPLRTRGVEVVDEKPEEIFRLLVTEGRSLTFLPGETVASADADQLAQPGDEQEVAARHRDSRLQTPYSSALLQSRLVATWHAARTGLEEQGINTLYLALGMLSWCEEDAPEKFSRAPLILIPVELKRSDARDRFHLKYTEEELGDNVSLAEKLKQSFAIRNFPALPDADELDLRAYFQQVQDAVSGQAGWTVDTTAVALGFFSFARFLMYRDLDPSTWPAPESILGHGVLQALLGGGSFPPASSNYRDDVLLDDQVPNRDLLHVVDADSSQTLAILDCLDGKTMVIQGPPGTGKSQTIVNLIAGAVAKDQRVLFVSEKMAALDVVKRRLDQAGLGAACLELHSNRTNKKTIIEELRRTALGKRPPRPQPRGERSLLKDARERLNLYCRAVNEEIGESGETPYATYGKLLELRAVLEGREAPRLDLVDAATWTAGETARRTQIVEQVQDRVAGAGLPSQHPFWGSRLTILLPADREEVRKLARNAASTCAAVESAGRSLAAVFSVYAPAGDEEAVVLAETARYVAGAPDLSGVDLQSADWLTRQPQIRESLTAGKRHRDLHRRYDAILRPEAWTTDTLELRRSVSQLGARWWRILSPRWRQSQKTLEGLCKSGSPPTQPAQLALLDAIAESIRCEGLMAGRPAGSDWELLERQADWVIGAHRGVARGKLAAWCLDAGKITAAHVAAAARLEELERTRQVWQAAVRQWSERLKFDDSLLAGESLARLQARWETQASRIDELHSLVAFNQLAAECDRERLGNLASIAATWEESGALLSPLYQRARLEALLSRAFQERPALATFDGMRHSKTVDDFRRLDVSQLEYNRAFLAAQHAHSLPSGGGTGEIGVLWREFEKRTRFLPLRSLMLKAGHAIQSIKRVFMMSPLSIASYLPPGALAFDLVIFDEASQVRPVDALGAIVRGQQVVVVGDSMQLPPTSFFDSLAGADEQAEDEATTASDLESVLGLFCSQGAHQRMLRWHYRSRHESLISVSNHLFYQDRLVVFPSPEPDRSRLGLVYHRVENAPYERSRTRTNPVEAQAVAQAVMAQAKRQLRLPAGERETLGVAAFSTAQMDAILTQLEVLRRQDPSCEEFFQSPPHEPFFVKNLENVQGDERDVIFISIGYGRTADGLLAMSFGPLNRNGGERRLNVLITRARKRCEVFTTLSAGDIDLDKTNSSGVAALKTFLEYAQSGQMDQAAPAGRSQDTAFEEQVRLQLAARGHQVDSQPGLLLDMTAGRLGIGCDGARYFSARSARDRDRLRDSVLQGLGWRIHRIWSTDWFHNPGGELEKLVHAIESGLAEAPVSTPAPPVEIMPEPDAPPPTVMPYEVACVNCELGDRDFHLVERPTLAAWLAEVVKVESPVHITDASRRVLSGAGVPRSSSRIQQAIEDAVRLGVDRRLFTRRQEFLWRPGMEQSPVRDRSGLPNASRRFEFVAPEEIRQAILIAVRNSCGILPAEVASAACGLLGFVRATDEMSAGIERHREALIGEGRLKLEGVYLVVT